MKNLSMLSALMLGLVVGAFLSFASCGGSKGNCSKTNCNGCCDAMGMCQMGTAPASCGAAGNTCAVCASGQSCTLAKCTGGSGVGGGSGTGTGGGNSGTGGGNSGTGGGNAGTGGGNSGAGGGNSGAGGGTVTCTTIALSNESVGGYYDIARDQSGTPVFSVTDADNRLNTNDLYTLELYDAPGMEAPAPYTANLAAANCGSSGTAACTFGNCNDCVQIYQGVTSLEPFRYGKLFFATSGTVDVHSKALVPNLPDGGVAGGHLRASASNVRLVEWEYDSDNNIDRPVPGGACFEITTTSWDAGW